MIAKIAVDSICVDASCLGNPGPVEYRGVQTNTGEELFHEALIPHGTNNLGEFLAIAHALSYLWELGRDTPIYSDSQTAILWIKKQKINTTLPRNHRTQEIWRRLDQALEWLAIHPYPNPILKWETAIWGEIPADFGRK